MMEKLSFAPSVSQTSSASLQFIPTLNPIPALPMYSLVLTMRFHRRFASAGAGDQESKKRGNSVRTYGRMMVESGIIIIV